MQHVQLHDVEDVHTINLASARQMKKFLFLILPFFLKKNKLKIIVSTLSRPILPFFLAHDLFYFGTMTMKRICSLSMRTGVV